jgi:hypothetical protein
MAGLEKGWLPVGSQAGLKSDYPQVVPYKRLTKERFLTKKSRKVQTYQEEAHSSSCELGWVAPC